MPAGGTARAIGAVLFGLLLNHAAQGQVPPHHWSHRYRASGADRGEAIAVDPSGNTVVFGTFRDTADFGGGPLVSAGDSDLFVAKWSFDGDPLWSVRFGSADDDYARGLAVDGDGAIYLTGSFTTAIDFGGGPLMPAAEDDIYIVKLDASGAHVWSQRFGDTDRDIGVDLAIDNGGFHVYLTGTFRSTVDFGGGSLVSGGGTDMFPAKFKATTGSHVWSYAFGANGSEGGQAVAIDGDDDVVLAG
jgi:DNA-binding beta-propeller fold protein YncE